MNNTKKVVSIVLAVLMVMSIVPTGFAFNPALNPVQYGASDEGTYFTYGTQSFENPSDDMWVDTSETTETIRLAADAYSTAYGNVVVKATPSGMPDLPKTGFYKFGLAGETAEPPKIVAKFYGVSNYSELTGVRITGTGISGYGDPSPSYENGTDSHGSFLRVTWTISNTGTATVPGGPGTNIVWAINYTYKRQAYTQYAYSHAEYIARPAGVALSGLKRALQDKNRAMGAYITVLQCAQSKSGYASSEVKKTRAYIDYTNTNVAKYDIQSNFNDNYCLEGMTYTWTGSPAGFLVKETSGNPGSVLFCSTTLGGATSTSASADESFSEKADDGNRAITTIWVDQGYDVLDKSVSGRTTYSGAAAKNGLNLRADMKVAQWTKFYNFCVYKVSLGKASSDFSALNGSATEYVCYSGDTRYTRAQGIPTASNVSKTLYINDAGRTTQGTNAAATAACIANGCKDDGTGGVLCDYCISEWLHSGQQGDSTAVANAKIYGQSYIEIPLGGVGPASTHTGNTSGYTFGWAGLCTRGTSGKRIAVDGTNASWLTESGRFTYSSCITINFRVYNTTQLQTLIYAIESGDYNYYNTRYSNGITRHFTSSGNEKNPQSWKYGSATGSTSWSTFKSAYDTAKSLVADFTAGHEDMLGSGTEQTNINNAVTNLLNAYNGLDYRPTGSITIKYRKQGTNVDIAPAETYFGFTDSSETVPTKDATLGAAHPFKTGVKFTLRPATITGYTAPSTVTGTAQFVNGTTTMTDDYNANLGSEMIFYYTPAPQNVLVYPNNGHSLLTKQVNTDDTPAWASYKTEMGDKEHYDFEGFWSTDNFASGTRVDNASPAYRMLPSATDVKFYAKWNPTKVQLEIIPMSGGNEIANRRTYSAAVTPTVLLDALQDVTFERPATDPSISGYDFVEYYLDEECSEIVNWDVIAGYTSKSSLEEEGTLPETSYIEINDNDEDKHDGNYTATIYANFVDLNNKVFFEPQGGTMPAGYETGEISFTPNTPFGYPVPTKDGYHFTGWVRANGTPISGWTVVENDPETPDNYAAVENGTTTLTTSAGFICYATWAPNTITMSFELDIPGDETSSLNSNPNASEYQDRSVLADQPITEILPTPRRYGYTFNYWALNGKKFKTDGKYPTSNFTLTAVWKQTSELAFGDLVSYIKLGGEYKTTDVQHGVQEQAVAGDVVTMRFFVSGKFFASSSSFIFAYDDNFYEPVHNDDVSVFSLNNENKYIKGIGAQLWEDTTSNHYGPIVSHVDPYQGTTVANVKTMQLFLDPDVFNHNGDPLGGKYETASMDDITYLVELRMKIKDTATGAGSFWLCEDQMRTRDNIEGDVFISYSAQKTTLDDVETDRVLFDDIVCTTIDLDPDAEERVDRTITLTLGTKGTDYQGSTTAYFADGSSADRTYTGPESTVITYSETAADHNEYHIAGVYETDEFGDETSTLKSFYGVPTPKREGYTFAGWFRFDNGTIDTNDEWTEGYYASEAQNGKTYIATWEANTVTFTFYYDEACTNIATTKTLPFDAEELEAPVAMSTLITEYYGWIPVGQTRSMDNIVGSDIYGIDSDNDGTPDNADYFTRPKFRATEDMSFYQYAENAKKTFKIQATPSGSETPVATITVTEALKDSIGVDVRYGSTVKIVNQVPSPAEEGVVYITVEDLVTIGFIEKDTVHSTATNDVYVFVDNANYELNTSALPVSFDIQSASASNVINLSAQGAIVRVTFDANAAFDEDETTLIALGEYNGECTNTTTINHTFTNADDETESYTSVGWYFDGRYGTPFDFENALVGITAPFGFTVHTFASSTSTFKNATYKVTYDAVKVTLKFVNEDGTAVERNLSSHATVPDSTNIAFNSSQALPTVSWISGWTVAKYDATTEKYVAKAGEHSDTSADIWSVGEDYVDSSNNIFFVPDFKTYKLTFKTQKTKANGSNDGAAVTQSALAQSPAYKSTFTVPAVPTAPTGYHVRKGEVNTTDEVWFYKTDNQTDEFVGGASATMIYNGAKTLTAYYDPNTFTLKFDLNGGSGTTPEDITAKFGAAVTLPTGTGITAPSGYTFGGWLDGTADFTATTMPNLGADGSTKTLKAKWVPVDYTITYDLAGGTVETANPATYNIDTETFTLNNPTKANYTFAGWTGSNGTTAQTSVSIAKGSTGNKSYTANWTANTFKLTYKVDGVAVTDYEDLDVPYGAVVSAYAPTTEPTKSGYTFKGWSYSPSLDGGVNMPAQNVTATAVFEEKTFTIKFDKDGGTGTAADISAKLGAAITLPELPTKTGYTCDGWYDGNTKVEWTTMPNLEGSSPKTLTAKYTPVTYNITYTLNNGSVAGTNPATYTIETNTITLINPTRADYTFAGWTGSNGTAPQTTVQIAKGSTGDKAYTANWTAKEYTITYDLAGGTVDGTNPVMFTTESDPITLINPTKAGYDFAGWTGSNGTTAQTAVTIATGSSGNKTYTANWTAHTYTVEINKGTDAEYVGSYTAPTSVTYGSSATVDLPNDVTEIAREGYKLEGWYDNSGFTGDKLADPYPVSAQENNGETLKFYAKWEKEEYTLVIDPDNGSEPEEYSTEYGKPFPVIDEPTKPGYTFDGWEGTGVSDDPTDPDYGKLPATVPDLSDNNTYTAKWVKTEYTVIFLQPDNMSEEATAIEFNSKTAYTGISGVTAELGEGLSNVPSGQPNPNEDFFTFKGWSLEAPVYNSDTSKLDYGKLSSDYDATIFSAEQLGSWTLTTADLPESGSIIYFYPVLDKVTVDIAPATDDDFVIDYEDEEGKTERVIEGYIYNLGENLKANDIEQIISADLTGNSEVIVTPSKLNKYCGTGTTITVRDLTLPDTDAQDKIIAQYYVIVFGDVEGGATCDEVDYDIVETQLAEEDAADRTWFLASSKSMLTANDKQLIKCYERAADLDASGTINSTDLSLMLDYIIGMITEYDLVEIEVTIDETPVTVKRYKAKEI